MCPIIMCVIQMGLKNVDDDFQNNPPYTYIIIPGFEVKISTK
jgi:hypothetical protein